MNEDNLLETSGDHSRERGQVEDGEITAPAENDTDDEDVSGLMEMEGIPLIDNPAPPPRREEPPTGLIWRDDAIMECFHLAVATHDAIPGSTTMEWNFPDTSSTTTAEQEFLSKWQPKFLPLPVWGVDPFVAPPTSEEKP